MTTPRNGDCMSDALHPSAPHDLPGFITAPGDTDTLMVAVGIVLLVAVLGVGNLYLHLHTLPERMAHKSQKGDAIFKLDSAKQEAAMETARRKIAEVDAAMLAAQADVLKAEGQIQQAKGDYQQ